MNLILFAQADGPVDGLNFSLINSHHIVRISPEAVVLKLYQRGVSPFDIWQSVSQQDSATGPQRPATAPQWQSQRPAILAPFGGLRLSTGASEFGHAVDLADWARSSDFITRMHCCRSLQTISNPDHEAELHVISVPLGEGRTPQIVKQIDVDALAEIRLLVIEFVQCSLAGRYQGCVQGFQRGEAPSRRGSLPRALRHADADCHSRRPHGARQVGRSSPAASPHRPVHQVKTTTTLPRRGDWQAYRNSIKQCEQRAQP